VTTNVLHHFFTNAHFVRKRLTRDETRDRIMIKADELFRQFGFGKTTVAELGMSPANGRDRRRSRQLSSSVPPIAGPASLPPIPFSNRTLTASFAGERKRPASKRGSATTLSGRPGSRPI
jgi:hypothetical protein